jgi:hypothetical protein
MQAIRQFLTVIHIINPSELFFGIGVCTALGLMAISGLFGLFFCKSVPPFGTGWKYGKQASALCATCSVGLMMTAAAPCLYPPDQVPDRWLAVMAVGNVIGCVALLGLLFTVGISWRQLKDHPGENEPAYFRYGIFVVPWLILLPAIILIYGFVGVH